MKRLAVPLTLTIVLLGCGPMIMTRPANVDAGGFDCVSATLQRLGYMITAGDRSLGFVRAERTHGQFRETNVLVVNYVVADTVEDESEDTIQVRASRPSGTSPSNSGVADAEQLLDRCGKL